MKTETGLFLWRRNVKAYKGFINTSMYEVTEEYGVAALL